MGLWKLTRLFNKRSQASSGNTTVSIASETLKAKVFTTIQDVPRDIWDGLVGEHSRTHSWAFWHSLEAGRLNDFKYNYVLFFDQTDAPVAHDLLLLDHDRFCHFCIQEAEGRASEDSSIFPEVLEDAVLECGCPITLSSPPFVKRDSVTPEMFARSLNHLMMQTAKADWRLLLVIRDFEDNSLQLVSDFECCNYRFVDSLPNAYMEIPWGTAEEYVRSMKSHYRSKLLEHLREKDRDGFRQVMVDDFTNLAEELHGHWQVVHDHAEEYQREILTPEFYRDFSASMGSQSKAILFYQHDELVGHALLLMDGDMLRWLFFGRSSVGRDGLYIYAAYKVIEAAILLGAKKLELGLTCYSTKLDLGAQPMRSQLAFKSSVRLLNPVVKGLLPLLNQVPKVSGKMIFKQ